MDEDIGQPTKKKKPWYLRWWVITLAALLALAVIGQFIDSNESQSTSVAEENQEAEGSEEDEEALVTVPDVLGMDLAEAQAELEDLDLIVEKYDTKEGRSILRPSNWEVAEQDPSGGEHVNAESVINLGVNRADDEDEEKSTDTGEAVTEEEAEPELDQLSSIDDLDAYVADQYGGSAFVVPDGEMEGDIEIDVESRGSELQDKVLTIDVLTDIGDLVDFEYEDVTVTAATDSGRWGVRYNHDQVQEIAEASISDGSLIIADIWDHADASTNFAY
ncbi:PASTA domain-containing protein [Brachybacterium alimentarium]|uniref:PASTA domain-containing protein n=1 Tax=Brachybacterium alimentarium TaxID=47845 RepID=UPI000DF1B4EB|nr:PASTA domain-containing protein [Brachybacterium alimentarium]RCS66504.1 PASTA domain-containing protein [Brachybacterium alimentarium]